MGGIFSHITSGNSLGSIRTRFLKLVAALLLLYYVQKLIIDHDEVFTGADVEEGDE